MEKRWFWRRVFALLIDTIILTQLAFFLVVPFADNESVMLSGGIFSSQSCKGVELTAEHLASFPAKEGETSFAQVCTRHENGIYAGKTFTIIHNSTGPNKNYTRYLRFAMNDNGQIIVPSYPVQYLAPIFFFVGMVLTTWLMNGKTIGKSLLGIRVAVASGGALTLGKSIFREAFKYLPFWLIWLGMYAYLTMFGYSNIAELFANPWVLLRVFAFFGLLNLAAWLVYWIIPLIWWRGAMPYDRFIGTVVRLNK